MLNATLLQRREITPDLLIFAVHPDGGVPDFVAGQYVALGLPGSAPRLAGTLPDKEPVAAEKLIKRAYSIGSAPTQKEALEFYIAVVRDGALTARLAALREGDRLFAAPKITGTFTLHDVPADKNLLLVATGTGLAPYISMLRTPTTWQPGRSITVVHGVRYPQDLGYREELESLQRRRPEFTYLPAVSRPHEGDGWQGLSGRVPRLFERGEIPLDVERDHVFLCGNPDMIDDLEKMLMGRGFTLHGKKNPVGNIHLERYW